MLTVLLTRGACPSACKDELAQCKLELMQSKVELASTSQSLEEERQAREAVEAELAATREKLLQAQLVIQTSSCFHQHFISRDSPASARSASPRDSPGHVASALEVGSDKSSDKSSDGPERAAPSLPAGAQDAECAGADTDADEAPAEAPRKTLAKHRSFTSLDSLPEDEEGQEPEPEDWRTGDPEDIAGARDIAWATEEAPARTSAAAAPHWQQQVAGPAPHDEFKVVSPAALAALQVQAARTPQASAASVQHPAQRPGQRASFWHHAAAAGGGGNDSTRVRAIPTALDQQTKPENATSKRDESSESNRVEPPSPPARDSRLQVGGGGPPAPISRVSHSFYSMFFLTVAPNYVTAAALSSSLFDSSPLAICFYFLTVPTRFLFACCDSGWLANS